MGSGDVYKRQLLALTPLLSAKDKGWVTLYNGKDLTGWQTTGNWLPQKDGSLLIQPRKGERGWQRYSAYLWSERSTRTLSCTWSTSTRPRATAGFTCAWAT